MRADRRRNVLAAARILGWTSRDGTTRPTRSRTAARMGTTERTVTRAWRDLERLGYLHCTEAGTTAAYRPGWHRHEGNLARSWRLVLPRTKENVTPPVVDLEITPTRPRETEISTGQPPWPLERQAHRRDEIRKAAESLRREHLVLRRISAPALASILRPWFTANSKSKSDREFTGSWTPADVLWAIEHLPSGHLHRCGASVRHPRAWLAYRLAFWAGHPPHSAELAARAERHRARRVPRRNPGTAPPAEWHEARAEIERRVRFPQANPPRKA